MLNIGLDLNILTTKIFTIMVIMALVTTFMTSPLLYYIYQKPYMAEKRKKKLEESKKEDDSQVEVDDETQTEDIDVPPPADDQSIHWADWKKSVDFIRKEQRKELEQTRDSISPSPEKESEMTSLP